MHANKSLLQQWICKSVVFFVLVFFLITLTGMAGCKTVSSEPQKAPVTEVTIPIPENDAENKELLSEISVQDPGEPSIFIGIVAQTDWFYIGFRPPFELTSGNLIWRDEAVEYGMEQWGLYVSQEYVDEQAPPTAVSAFMLQGTLPDNESLTFTLERGNPYAVTLYAVKVEPGASDFLQNFQYYTWEEDPELSEETSASQTITFDLSDASNTATAVPAGTLKTLDSLVNQWEKLLKEAGDPKALYWPDAIHITMSEPEVFVEAPAIASILDSQQEGNSQGIDYSLLQFSNPIRFFIPPAGSGNPMAIYIMKGQFKELSFTDTLVWEQRNGTWKIFQHQFKTYADFEFYD